MWRQQFECFSNRCATFSSRSSSSASSRKQATKTKNSTNTKWEKEGVGAVEQALHYRAQSSASWKARWALCKSADWPQQL
ncbi:unnamed protein product [Ceratitis capitata]|uniref:(Mediterranean fruit fly) hypothetical protein n=1 Tax=Ceratitis capitata TaxID=7213 RepID=A0A811UN98_CERCA|nr:unnamed protein product [Ceratitis capitata]